MTPPPTPSCARMEEAISARADGEDTGMDPEVLDAHLARCPSCRRFEAGVAEQQRLLRVRVSEPVPDLRDRIDAAVDAPPPRRRPPTLVLVTITAAAVLVLFVAFVVTGFVRNGGGSGTVSVRQVAGSNQTDPRYPGATVFSDQEAVGKPNVTLTDTAGQPYNLTAQTAGRVTLVYFGYTNCPDVCPINMAQTSDALRAMPAAQRDQVTVVFITTDPERDTGPVMRAWLDHFDGGLTPFVGLHGTVDQVHAAEQDVKMALSYTQPSKVPGQGYLDVHAGYTLIYTTAGMANLSVDATESVKDYATTLEHLVTKGFVRST